MACAWCTSNWPAHLTISLHIVLGTVSDKDIEPHAGATAKEGHLLLLQGGHSAGLDARSFCEHRRPHRGSKGEALRERTEAFEAARSEAAAQDLVLVTGSVFVVAEVLCKVDRLYSRPFSEA